MRCFLVAAAMLFQTSVAYAEEAPAFVRMSLERYAELMASAERNADGRVSWSRGNVQVSRQGEVVVVSASGTVRTFGEGASQVVLLPADVALRSANVAGSSTLVRMAAAHVAVVEDEGEKAVSLSYVVPVRRGPDGAPYAMIPLPPFASADFSATGFQEGSVWPASELSRNGANLRAVLPSSAAALLRWDRETATSSVRSVSFSLQPDRSGDGVDVQASYEIEASGGTTAFRIAPQSAALIDVRTGKSPLRSTVRDGWHTGFVRGKGRVAVTARFRLPIDRTQGQPQVTLSPNRVPIAKVDIEVPGKREVKMEPAVPMETTYSGAGDKIRTRALAHLPPSDTVSLRWTEARAAPESLVRINTETYQLLTLQEGVLRSRVKVRYDVIHGKTKELPIQLPEGVVLYKVEGEGIEDWRIFPKTEKEPRHVRVVLGRDLDAAVELELQLENVVSTAEGTPLSLPVVRPLGAFREMGVVAFFDGDKVGFAPATVSGFTKVGQDALPADIRQGLRDTVNQAYKHVGEPGTMSSKVATAKAREIHFDARIDTLYTIREAALTVQSSVLVELKSGRTDKIIVTLPAGEKEPRITAPSKNKMEKLKDFAVEGRDAYEVSFTQALEGAIQLDVELERILDAKADKLDLPAVHIHEADVESGSFGIARETGMEVQAETETEVTKVPAGELPKAVTLRSDLEVRLGYRYARAPWGLAVTVKRHQTVQTLNAVAQHVWLQTNVLESGHVTSRATYEVANDDREYLWLALPKDAKVLRVAAGGKKIKAEQNKEGAIAIQLPKNQTFMVDVVYEVRGEALGAFDSIAMLAPKADIRARDIQWIVRLPGDLTVLSEDTELQPRKRYEWTAMPGGDGGVQLPKERRTNNFVFALPVRDAAADALQIKLKVSARPGAGVHGLLFLLSLFLLAFAGWRRGLKAQFGALDVGLVVGGVVALLLKAAGWGLDGAETGLFIIVILAVGWVGRRKRRARELASEMEV